MVRRQAKLDPPLTNIQQGELLTTTAEITLNGQTVAGDRVTATGHMQITFADFLDTATSCPSIWTRRTQAMGLGSFLAALGSAAWRCSALACFWARRASSTGRRCPT